MSTRTADEKTEVQPRKHQVLTLKVVILLCLGAFLLGGFLVVCLNTRNVNIKLPKLGGCHEHKLAPERLYFYDDYFETTYAEYATELLKRDDNTDKTDDKTTDKKDDKTTDKKDDKTTDKKDDKTTDKKDDKTTDKKDDKTTDKKDDKTTDKKDDKTTDKPTATDEKKDDNTDKTDATDSPKGVVTKTRLKVQITVVKSNLRPSDMPSESESSSKGPTKPLDQAGVQFALALAGIVMLNMLAICIHHVYHVASDTSKSYRNVEQDISPF